MQLNRQISISIPADDGLVYHATSSTAYYSNNQTGALTYWNGMYSNEDGDFGISVGSLHLEEVLCSGEFSLNQLCASKFEVQCFNLSTDLTGREITVTCTENGVEKPLFKGIIDSSSTDNFNDYRDIIAYDELYTLRDKNVGEWWDTFWSSRPEYTAVSIPVGSPVNNEYYEQQNSQYVLSEDTTVVSGKTYYYGKPIATIGQIRTALCTAVGLNYVNTTLVNDSIQVKQYYTSLGNSPTQVTFGDLMSRLCEINGCVGHINRQGSFEFVSLSNNATTLGAYEKATVNFEDYTTKLITGINVYESPENLMLSYGDNTNAYSISGNIFTLALDSYDVLRTICSRILSVIGTIQYTPCSIPMVVSNLDLQLGNKVTSDIGTHYILSQTFSGSLFVEQTIDCPAYGEVLTQEVSDLNNTIVANERYSAIYQDQNEIRTEVSLVSSSVSAIQSQITIVSQTAGELAVRVGNNERAISSTDPNAPGLTQQVSDLQQRDIYVSITTEGVRISQGETGAYVIVTDSGMEIYTEGIKTAWAEADGFSASELMIGDSTPNRQKWHLHEANDGNTLMFLRR